MAKAKARTKKKEPAFELDVETRFEFTGRGTTAWFQLLEEDDYEKIGGKFFPDNPDKINAVVQDLLAEAQAQCDEAGLTVTQVDPQKKDDDGNIYYKVDRKAVKANGDPADIKFKDITGKKDLELEEELGNGSVVNIKYYARPYYMAAMVTAGVEVPARIGVSLSPTAIQIIDHKIYTGGDDGFDNEMDDEFDGGDDAPFDNEGETGSDDY
jgi:hypothetical protein